MIPNIYNNPKELTSPLFAKAFAEGCGHNKMILLPGEYVAGPWAGFGSPDYWQSLELAQKDGFDWYYGDHAYFGRGVFYRVTKNNYQCMDDDNPDYERLKPFYEAVKPWKKEGKNIIVCPQSAGHHERFGQPDWLEKTLKTLQENTDRKIKIRRKKDYRSLFADLQNAYAVVTHTSNAAVEALLEGVPVICTEDCAASKFGIKDPSQIENIIYPDFDRLKWAATLANNQWTLEEITAGKCWEAIK